VQTKSGQRYNNEYCFVFKFRGDKIAEVVEYCDTDLEERVLGNYDDAVKAFIRGADLNPSDERCYKFLARAYDSSPSQAADVIERYRISSEIHGAVLPNELGLRTRPAMVNNPEPTIISDCGSGTWMVA